MSAVAPQTDIPVAYKRAIARLHEGQNASHQEPSVKRLLKVLERAYFIHYTSFRHARDGGWYLSERGRAVVESMTGEVDVPDEDLRVGDCVRIISANDWFRIVAIKPYAGPLVEVFAIAEVVPGPSRGFSLTRGGYTRCRRLVIP